MLDSRTKIILRELMAARTPVTGSYLAKINQVTARTTREDIKNLSTILEEHGAQIESLMGKGYKLEIKEENLFRHYLKMIANHEEAEVGFVPRTPEERTNYIIKRLLLNEDYTKLEDLADEIYISKSTIQNDIKHVKEILCKYDISLEARPNYGLKVKGDELKLRFCMSEYVFERNDDGGDQLIDFHLASFAQEDLDSISEIIMDQINTHHITLSDIAINNLLVHIAIAYKRIKSGYHVTLYQTDIQDIVKQKEYEVAKEIVEKVEDKFKVTFPETEIAYIAIHLLGTKMISQANESVEQVMDEEILQIVTVALEKIEKEFNLGIKDDQELILGLGLHLKPAVNRYKFGMNIRNPMIEDIKKNYPLAFEAAVIAGIAIGEHTGTNIDENEVGYLALHIGAAIERRKLKSGPKRCLIVCASGFGTAQLIYYKLKTKFGKDLDVLGTTEYYKLKNYNLHEIDFIVSSIPIQDKLPAPVIEVNAILGDNDLKKIEEFVLENKQSVQMYFEQELMFLRKRFQSRDAVIEFLDHKLRQKGLVDDTFLESIYEREKVAPTSFGNLVAVPHPITPKTEKTFLTVCTLEKPIMWQDKPVQFVCLLCVKKNSEEDLQAMYDMLAKVIDNSTIVQKLIKVKSYEEFMNVLIG
ncbi:PRD domain-containing protein [Ornithinibacillus sp. L9]|uniref:PRD domain-containing protein n=1 Tax=Ornithinibacillus caprae TaxID=2678566 RepID=A0A6N8FK20_9BACI|nr:BglG family transcription antiterminator [Ornithinibacillus caprae]MUK87648.1 PRD domain-containing protein [Ornithinibacillus caprae]